MCGRYTFEPESSEEIKRIEQLAEQAGYQPKRGEVFPGDKTAIVVYAKNQVQVAAMPWGFPAFSDRPKQLLINARSETVLEKNLFAESFIKRRCVYPTSGFFEWSADKKKFIFNYQQKNRPIYIAGFYNFFNRQTHSILLTTQPNSSVAHVHDRMPLILEKKAIKPWLTDLDFAKKYLSYPMPELFSRQL